MSRESEDPYYDLFDDFDVIISSFQTQYGLRLSREINGMMWNEFVALLSGLGPETPLGRLVAIRAENDKDILKTFSPAQKRIRNEYRRRRAKRVPQQKIDDVLEQLKQAFIAASKG